MNEPVALIDLDGTTADYDTAILAALESIRSPNEEAITSLRNAPEWLENRIRMIRKVPGFWRNLVPIVAGFKILNLLKECGYSLNVLTKGPVSSTNAWTEKVEWCREHIPDAKITISEDKGIVYGKVLFDDWPDYIKSWLAWRPRGLVLMPDRRWNKDFEHPQVIRVTDDSEETLLFLKTKLLEVL